MGWALFALGGEEPLGFDSGLPLGFKPVFDALYDLTEAFAGGFVGLQLTAESGGVLGYLIELLAILGVGELAVLQVLGKELSLEGGVFGQLAAGAAGEGWCGGGWLGIACSTSFRVAGVCWGLLAGIFRALVASGLIAGLLLAGGLLAPLVAGFCCLLSGSLFASLLTTGLFVSLFLAAFRSLLTTGLLSTFCGLLSTCSLLSCLLITSLFAALRSLLTRLAALLADPSLALCHPAGRLHTAY